MHTQVMSEVCFNPDETCCTCETSYVVSTSSVWYDTGITHYVQVSPVKDCHLHASIIVRYCIVPKHLLSYIVWLHDVMVQDWTRAL